MYGVIGQIFIRLLQVVWSVSISAILSETTHLFILVIFALLGLIVVIGNVKQLELHLDGQCVHLETKRHSNVCENLHPLSVLTPRPRGQSGRRRL